MTHTKGDIPQADTPKYGKGSNFKGKPGRSGAPKKNGNALRHGLHGSKMPDGCAYIENRVNAIRRTLEELVLARKGEVSFTDAATINSVLKHERAGLLATHWLRTEGETLKTIDKLKFNDVISRSSDNRDKSIRLLELDKQTDQWAFLDQPKLIESITADTSNGDLEEK